MNREILFRGKKPVEYYNMIDNSGGKWVEGYLIALHDGQSPAIQSEIKIVPDYVGARIDSKIFCVIPETVSQFTGLYDKNGVRIFENDIVRFTCTPNWLYQVIWDKEFAMFGLKCVKSPSLYNKEACGTNFYDIDSRDVEVIGNRFDNSDLLNQ